MVKTCRTMEPEAVNLEKAGRGSGKSFQEDSFHNYMARKISLQRKQFGLVVPPDPRHHPQNEQHMQHQQKKQQHHQERHSQQLLKKQKSHQPQRQDQQQLHLPLDEPHDDFESLSEISNSRTRIALGIQIQTPIHEQINHHNFDKVSLQRYDGKDIDDVACENDSNQISNDALHVLPYDEGQSIADHHTNIKIYESPIKPKEASLQVVCNLEDYPDRTSKTKRRVHFALGTIDYTKESKNSQKISSLISNKQLGDVSKGTKLEHKRLQSHRNCKDSKRKREKSSRGCNLMLDMINRLQERHGNLGPDDHEQLFNSIVGSTKIFLDNDDECFCDDDDEDESSSSETLKRNIRCIKDMNSADQGTTDNVTNIFYPIQNKILQVMPSIVLDRGNISDVLSSSGDVCLNHSKPGVPLSDHNRLQKMDVESSDFMSKSVEDISEENYAEHRSRSTTNQKSNDDPLSIVVDAAVSYHLENTHCELSNKSGLNEFTKPISEGMVSSQSVCIDIIDVDTSHNDGCDMNDRDYLSDSIAFVTEGEECSFKVNDNEPVEKLDTIVSPKSRMTAGKQPTRNDRPDLFFLGIVVIVNGYTNPDLETIQRLLHKHGGDVERYETSRVTHIIAEHLSTAKAKMYKKQRKPKPVCYPTWITDSVQQQKLLPYGEYIIDEMKDSNVSSVKSVKSFFNHQRQRPDEPDQQPRQIQSKNVEIIADINEQQIVNVDMKANSVVIDVQGSNQSIEEVFVVTDVDSPMDECAKGSLSDKTESSNDDIRELVRDTSWGITRQQPAIDGCNNGRTNECTDNASTAQFQTDSHKDRPEKVGRHNSGSITDSGPNMDRFIDGRARTVGTDPNFLESFFAASRLSFIGSYKQRAKQPAESVSSSVNTNKKACERYVAHVDMDCFFAAVALRNYPQYKNKPVAISHQGKKKNSAITSVDSGNVPKNSTSECATCNYEARKFGIKKGMFLSEARMLCPDLVVLQYDFEGYEEVAEQVSHILYRHASMFDGYVEQVSCDEAYVELFIPYEGDSLDGMKASSCEVVFKVAEAIRVEIFDNTQCTATVGVGANKLLAKVATDHVKPNKSFVLTDHKELLKHRKLRELNGIGYRFERKLVEEDLLTIQDVWNLGKEGESILCRILGPSIGKKVFKYCSGIDDRPVQPTIRKTIGAECNYGVRFDGPYGVDHMIRGLAKEVEKRMTNVDVTGSQITLKVKRRKPNAPPPPKYLGHGSCFNISKSQPLPNFTRDKDIIADVAIAMFEEIDIPKEDVRGMGVTISKLNTENQSPNGKSNDQSTILKWFKGPRPENQEESSIPIEKMNQTDSDVIHVDHRSFDSHSDSEWSTGVDLQEYFEVNTAENDTSIIVDESVTTPSREDAEDFSLALPPLSQIHMSQVKALPLDLQHQIESQIRKMQKSKGLVASYGTESDPLIVDDDDGQIASRDVNIRFRQTNVKRMLQLAAVKTGQQVIPGYDPLRGIDSVSLSQLEQLPLEMQLQIANGDQNDLGKLTTTVVFGDDHYNKKNSMEANRKRRFDDKQKQLIATTSNDDDDCSLDTSITDDPHVIDKKMRVFERMAVSCKSIDDSAHFYRSDILPLHTFMSESALSSNEFVDDVPIMKVIEFLSVCVNENRLSDVVIMLRSIYRRPRDDYWNINVLERIYSTIDQIIQKQWHGVCLDKNWITS